MRNKGEALYFRVQCGFDFFGTLIHHSSTSLIIVSLTTHREFVDRNLLGVALPLVVQHWLVLVRYIDTKLCSLLCLTVEIFWEWQVFYFVQDPCISFNFRWTANAMLIAHWFYLTAAGMALAHPNASKVLIKKDPMNKHRHSVVHDAMITAESHYSMKMKEMPTESSVEATEQYFGGTFLSALSYLPKQAGNFVMEAARAASNYEATPAEDESVVDDWTRALGSEPEEKESGATDVEGGQAGEANGQQDPAGSVWEQIRALVRQAEAAAEAVAVATRTDEGSTKPTEIGVMEVEGGGGGGRN